MFEYQKIHSKKPEITLFLMAESGFLHHDVTGSVKGLNALSLLIWFAVEDGLDDQEIMSNLVRQHPELDIPDTELVLQDLRIFHQTGQLQEYPNDWSEPWVESISPVGLPADQKNQYFKVFDTYFIFTSAEAELKPMLRQLFSAVEKPCDSDIGDGYLFEVMTDNEVSTVAINGQTLMFRFTPEQLPCFLFNTVRKLAKKDVQFLMASHAALGRKNATTIMLPAQSGSGKSTLSAALMSEGFELYTDELVVVDSEERAMAMPLAVGLKEGSWSLLGQRYPILENLPVYERSADMRIKYLPVKNNCIQTDVNYLIFPQFNDSCSEPVLVREVSMLEAVHALFAAGFHTSGFLSVEAFERVLQWVLSKPCLSLEFSDVFAASRYLDDLTVKGLA